MRVNVYRESMYTNRFFRPRLEAVLIVFWVLPRRANSKFVSIAPAKELSGKLYLILKGTFKIDDASYLSTFTSTTVVIFIA